MRKESDENAYKRLIKDINVCADRWIYINDNGCQDPFYSDGTNMNLDRNHIIYEKRQLVELCDRTQFPIPLVMKLNVPPLVPDDYMCHTPLEPEFDKTRRDRNNLTRHFEKIPYKKYTLKVRS